MTSIGSYVFEECNLKSIMIPESIVEIGSNAFQYCSKLTDVYYTGSEKQWEKIVIEKGNQDLTSAALHYNATEIIVEDEQEFND